MCSGSPMPPRTARAAASAPSSRPACGRTCSPHCSTRARRSRPSSWPATTARRATSPPTSRPSSARASCASIRRAACVTSRTSRRPRTSSGCGWQRSTRSRRGRPRWGPAPPPPPRRDPAPELRPRGFTIEKGGAIDLEETAEQLAAAGYERVDQVEDRGQFAIRGDILDVYPAPEERAVRCELFDIEVERLTFFSTFTQRSLEEAEQVEIAPAAEIGPEHRELAEMAALEEAGQRPDVAEVLPVDRFCDVLSLVPADSLIAIAAEEEIEPSLVDYWEEVTTSFHDEDAHHLYLSPDTLREQLDGRTSLRLSSI